MIRFSKNTFTLFIKLNTISPCSRLLIETLDTIIAYWAAKLLEVKLGGLKKSKILGLRPHFTGVVETIKTGSPKKEILCEIYFRYCGEEETNSRNTSHSY